MLTKKTVIQSCVTLLFLVSAMTSQNLFASQAIKVCGENVFAFDTVTNQPTQSVHLPFEAWSVGTFPDSKMLSLYPLYRYKYNMGNPSENIVFNTQDLSFSLNNKFVQAIYDQTNLITQTMKPSQENIDSFEKLGVNRERIVIQAETPHYIIDNAHQKVYLIRHLSASAHKVTYNTRYLGASITNTNNNTVLEILDANDLSAEGPVLDVGFDVLQMMITPDGKEIYLMGSGGLFIFNITNYHLTILKCIFQNEDFHSMAMRPDGKKVYLSSSPEDNSSNARNAIVIVDTTTHYFERIVAPEQHWRPREIAFTSDSKNAIITNFDSDYFFVLPTDINQSLFWSNRPQKKTTVNGGMIALASPVVTPQGMVYFALYDSPNVVAYDLNKNSASLIEAKGCDCKGSFSCNQQAVVLSH